MLLKAHAAPRVDPRAKAGAFGEAVRRPHKLALDEMGPRASLPIPAVGAPRPERPVRTIDVPTEVEKKGRRGPPPQDGKARALGGSRWGKHDPLP